MKEFKGTPGPWRVVEIANASPAIDGEHTTIVLQHYKTELSEHNNGIVFNGGEDIHNARLIAASPDLLDACIQLMDCYNKHGQLLSFNVNIIREAVNKALGK